MALFTKAELAKKTPAELLALAKKNGFEYDDKPSKAQVIEDLLDLEEDDEEEEIDDDELDDEELDDEDEELDDDEEEVDDIEEPVKKSKPASKKPAKVKKSADDENTLAAKQVATILGTEAKTLRQFLRSSASTTEAVGSGGRYEFLETDVPLIKKEFEAWRAAHAARGSKRGPGKGKGTPANIEEIQEVEEIEELEELDDEIDDEDLELDDDEEDD